LGCTTPLKDQSEADRYTSFSEQAMAIRRTSSGTFAQPVNLIGSGAFRFEVHRNLRIPLNPEKVVLIDAYVPTAKSSSPLLILAHGNNSAKEAHAGQAEHLASWGFHVVLIQLKKREQWLENGDTVRELTSLLSLYPTMISAYIDTKKIIIAGHSFGGSAAILAAAQGAPVRGVILLDPAVVNDRVKKVLSKVSMPVMLIGADPKVFRSRQRKSFFKGVQGEAGEITVSGATHDDAQFPSMFALHAFGFDPFTSSPQRQTFLKAITATALSLAVEGNLQWAWRNLAAEFKTGELINPQRKSRPRPY